MSSGKGWFESDSDYRDRMEREANERTIEDATGSTPSRGWFESDDNYSDRISREANEQTVESATGAKPSRGWFESEENYSARVDREANERIVEMSGGSRPTKGLFESDDNYETRVRQEANEATIKTSTGNAQSKGLFESDYEYRQRIDREANEYRASSGGNGTYGGRGGGYSGGGYGSYSGGSSSSSGGGFVIWVIVGVMVLFVISMIGSSIEDSPQDRGTERRLTPLPQDQPYVARPLQPAPPPAPIFDKLGTTTYRHVQSGTYLYNLPFVPPAQQAQVQQYCDSVEWKGFTDWRAPSRSDVSAFVEALRRNRAGGMKFFGTNSCSEDGWNEYIWLSDSYWDGTDVLGLALHCPTLMVRQRLPTRRGGVFCTRGGTSELDTLPAESTTRALQKELMRLNCRPGPVDGIIGQKTLSAVRAFSDANERHFSGTIDVMMRSVLAAARQIGAKPCEEAYGMIGTWNGQGSCNSLFNRSQTMRLEIVSQSENGISGLWRDSVGWTGAMEITISGTTLSALKTTTAGTDAEGVSKTITPMKRSGTGEMFEDRQTMLMTFSELLHTCTFKFSKL